MSCKQKINWKYFLSLKKKKSDSFRKWNQGKKPEKQFSTHSHPPYKEIEKYGETLVFLQIGVGFSFD